MPPERPTPPATAPARRPRPVLTGRALVLGAVLVALVVVLASPVRRYLSSRGEVSSSAQQLHDDRAELARLKLAQAHYEDPGYVQQQARKRLQYAMPGDTVYVVVGNGAESDLQRTNDAARSPADKAAWNTRLMDSIRSAAR